MFFKKLFLWLAPIVAVVLFFATIFPTFRLHAHSFQFADEAEHVTMGWMMVEHGAVLYRDLSTNHQPMPFWLSAIFWKLFSFENLFMAIDRLRLFALALTAGGSLLLALRWRWWGALASVLVYISAPIFFGWHILQELLLPMSVLMILGLLIDQWQLWLLPKPQWARWFDPIMMAVSLWVLFFSHAMMWPWVALTSLLWMMSANSWSRRLFVWSGVMLFGFTSLILDWGMWWQESVSNLFIYYVMPESGATTLALRLKPLIYPFLFFDKLSNPLAWRWLLPALVVLLGFAILALRAPKQRFSLLLLILLVMLLNLRRSDGPSAFYQAFHLWPLWAGWMGLLSLVAVKFWEKGNLVLRGVLLALLTLWLAWSGGWVIEKKDRLNEFFIQYGDMESFGRALRIVKLPGDRLLTGPAGQGWVNIVADLPLAGRQHAHLPWAWRSPRLRKDFLELLRDNSPTFIYYPMLDGRDYSSLLIPVLDDRYLEITRADGRLTGLFMLRSQTDKIESEKWADFADLFFTNPSISATQPK